MRLIPEQQPGTTMRLLKRSLSAGIGGDPPYWQPGYFDHVLRHGESYSQKWRYVCENPVRAGLVEQAVDWPYQGEILDLEF